MSLRSSERGYVRIKCLIVLVTLTMIHDRAPPTLNDGALPDVIGHEDDGDFVEYPGE
ncbi:hypothetical protein A2U01_0059429 [Trifolium medium]|uniref:Uncharacterized protein n=1 Tax=Trifolium medium TaxID=97028 RepID=A0A392RNI3_9FABA|nr:hypothetical protein [Trifolium medium]